jgi:hypothetical protein
LDADLPAGCDGRVDGLADDGISPLQSRVSPPAQSREWKYGRRKAPERVDALRSRLYY